MNPALYVGSIRHQRFIPKAHRFRYPFFMWFLNLDQLDRLPEIKPWFGRSGLSLSRFRRADYYGDPGVPLAQSIKQRLAELTREPVQGQVCGLLNLRTLGLYFSPVNFYFGYDDGGSWTHFLAEVSNTPWNQRHQYGYLIDPGSPLPRQQKQFHVSPFNGLDQIYNWEVSPPGEQVRITIDLDDHRGRVFSATLELERRELSSRTVSRQLLRRPVMTASIIGAIYWQALKLYLKGVPYVPYRKEAT